MIKNLTDWPVPEAFAMHGTWHMQKKQFDAYAWQPGLAFFYPVI
jgi:hypothetical protein